VEGLPAPVRFGRAAALTKIGQRLALMRRERREPDLVLLQEAFASPAGQIAREAGYRYVADGPSADAVNDVTAPANAAGFVASSSHLKGESDGKWVDSGLRILSDYPIVRVERLAFPAWACAGYDCLANKGALIAWVALPGSGEPVAVIDTHLNSRAASGVAKARADAAYAFQVAALRTFIAQHVPKGSDALLGGDFNSGRASIRRADLRKSLLAGGRNSLLEALAQPRAIPEDERGASQAILSHGKDWLFYRGSSRRPIALTGFEVPFGQEADGTMLSDHMGYEAHYRVGADGPKRPYLAGGV
jgi:endonuclease/exonuclease/phosphatase family metal-dependent hydrolase